MTILMTVATTAARHLVCGICKTTGVVSEEAAERAFQSVVAHFSDHSQKLPRAVAAANDRAWKTLEIALGGERFYGWLTSATDKSLANDIRRHLDALSPAHLPGDRAEFQKACLKDLREARRRGLLGQGGLAPQSLRQQAGDLARFADPRSLADAQRQAAGAVAGILIAEGFASLGCFLGLPTPHGSLLLVAFDWYFTDAVAKDAELSNKLVLAKLDRITDAGMGKVAGLLDSRFDEIDAVLAGISEAVIETRERAKRIEDKIDRMMHLLAAKGVRDGTVRLTDGIALQGQEDEKLLAAFDLEVRAIPEAERQRPDLVLINARMASAKGRHDQAISDYHRVAEATSDQRVRAEARYGAYRATLERASRSKKPEDWTAALAELTEAAKLDPHRYAPFDLGKYQPMKILGVGGFGVTFLCRHRVGEGRVVIKTLLEEQSDEQQRQRVLTEGRVLMKFNHPNVVRIFDIDFAARPEQRPYFVMEYCGDGFTDLEQYVAKHGTLKPAELRTVAGKVAEGLKAAHAAGVLHRDIKPANILVKRETRPEGAVWHVKLIDFGLALRNDLLQAGQQGSTSKQGRSILAGEIAGTLAYAPPEQMDSERQGEVVEVSDIYSLGKTCYYALFKTPTPDDHQKEKLPQEWRTLLGRCTAQEDISKRPKSADEFIKALKENEEGHREPASNEVMLKAAGASLLPGLGHILIGQPIKGGIFLAVGLLFLLGWWWYLGLILAALIVLGGGPVLGIAAIAALSGGIQAAMDSKARRVVLGLTCLALPFVLLPAVVECPWPTHFLAWVLVTGADAVLTVWMFGGKRTVGTGESGDPALRGTEATYLIGKSQIGPVPSETLADLAGQGVINDETYIWIKGGVIGKDWVRFKTLKDKLPRREKSTDAMPGWTLFGEQMTQLEPKRSALGGVGCLACVVLSLFISGWLFGASSSMRQQIVGTWELRDGDTVEFTREGAALHRGRHGTTDQGRYKLTGSRTLEVITSSGFMSKHTDRYTVEFSSPDEMVLVAQERGIFDGNDRGSFPTIAGKLARADAKPATTVEPDARLLGRWVKADSRTDAGEEESIVVTAQTLLYAKPKVRMFGLDQHSTPLSWATSTKAKLAKGNGSIQIEVVSDKEIVVSFQGRSLDFDKVTGRYRRARE